MRKNRTCNRGQKWAYAVVHPCTCRYVGVCVCVCMHTHSWPSHSCVRASSGCRSDAHPGRRVSPALWIPPSALPSASRTASRSCIAPLQIKTHMHEHKHCGQRSTTLRHKGNRCLTLFVFSQEEVKHTASQRRTISNSWCGAESKQQQRWYCVSTQGCFSVTHWPAPESNSEKKKQERSHGGRQS